MARTREYEAAREIDTLAGFDAVHFAGYLRARFRIVAVCCAIAVVGAAVVSMLLPRRYTATASILIGAPAGLDPRAATSVSPVYLESLRTYEHLATSDSLFQKALEHLGLRQQYSGRSIEGLKRSVLKVSKPLNTRVIEISATLDTPARAQALAQYIAQQTVALSRAIDTQTASDLTKEATSSFEAASKRVAGAEAAEERLSKAPGTTGLQAELAGSRDLKFQVERDLVAARAESADGTHRAALEGQVQTLDRTITLKDAQMERLTQQREAADAELLAARKEFEAVRLKLNEVREAAAFRGERLDVFDPGIVPERPSSPNIPLNIAIALLISVAASTGYLALRYGYERALGR